MKKLLTAITLSALLFTTAACSGGAETNIVPADAANAIISNVAFKDSLIEAQGDLAKEWYLMDDKVTDFAVYVSGSGATAEEVAVLKSSDVKSAKKTVEARVEDLKFRFENYVPTEMEKLNNPLIVTSGDTVILVLCDDKDSASKFVDTLTK